MSLRRSTRILRRMARRAARRLSRALFTAAVGPQEEQRRLAQLKLLEVKKKSAAWAYWG